MFQAQQSERSKAETGDQLKIDNADQSSFEKTDEVDKSEEETSPIQNSNQDITHSPKNENFFDEEEDTDQLHPLTSRPRLKYSSSHPLDNLI